MWSFEFWSRFFYSFISESQSAVHCRRIWFSSQNIRHPTLFTVPPCTCACTCGDHKTEWRQNYSQNIIFGTRSVLFSLIIQIIFCMIPGQIGEILQRPAGQWGVPGLTVWLVAFVHLEGDFSSPSWRDFGDGRTCVWEWRWILQSRLLGNFTLLFLLSGLIVW